MSFYFRRYMIGFVVLVGAIGPVKAAVPPEKEKPIIKKIEEELKATLDRLTDEKAMATRFGFAYPVEAPEKSPAAVQAIVDERIKELALKMYPDSWVQKELEKIEDQFLQWDEGDRVKGTLKDGKEFEGWLRSKDSTKIKINAREIRLTELSMTTLLHLDQRRAMDARKQASARLHKSLLALRAKHMREIRVEQIREIYKQEGYISVKGRWMPKLEFFQKRVEEQRANMKKLIEGPLAYKHYYQAGYRQFKNDWFTPEEVVKLRYLARIEEELNPVAVMAELDLLNSEDSTGVNPDKVDNLFGDDGDGKKKEKEKEKKPPKKNVDEF